jgi:hypothetical protein
VTLKGELAPNATLTESQALAILGDARPYAAIAADYGVTTTTISDIKCRRSWSHLKVDQVARAKRVSHFKGVGKKIDADIVREIRTSEQSGKALAERFGVTQQLICNIRKRRSWSDIE